MSHFAIVDKDDFVAQVQRITQEVIDTGLFGNPSAFIQTSYNTRGGIHYGDDGLPSPDQSKALRKNYAGIGFKYDRVRDAFIPPQDYPSWTLNESTCLWDAPTPMPTDGKPYRWHEPSLSWVEIVIDGGSA
jgi:hypothetical protein